MVTTRPVIGHAGEHAMVRSVPLLLANKSAKRECGKRGSAEVHLGNTRCVERDKFVRYLLRGRYCCLTSDAARECCVRCEIKRLSDMSTQNGVKVAKPGRTCVVTKPPCQRDVVREVGNPVWLDVLL